MGEGELLASSLRRPRTAAAQCYHGLISSTRRLNSLFTEFKRIPGIISNKPAANCFPLALNVILFRTERDRLNFYVVYQVFLFMTFYVLFLV